MYTQSNRSLAPTTSDDKQSTAITQLRPSRPVLQAKIATENGSLQEEISKPQDVASVMPMTISKDVMQAKGVRTLPGISVIQGKLHVNLSETNLDEHKNNMYKPYSSNIHPVLQQKKEGEAIQLMKSKNKYNTVKNSYPNNNNCYQLMGSYIPSMDGPYGHNFTDGPSTAGAVFGAPLQNDIYNINGMNTIAEAEIKPYQSDEDGDTMLTRNTAAVAQVDHIYPAILGGSSSHRNAAIISQESNQGQGNAYPKDYEIGELSGTRIIMGHPVIVADRPFRGQHINGIVSAYNIFDVNGAGPAAQIDMTSIGLPADVSPFEAKTLGILPPLIPNPR